MTENKSLKTIVKALDAKKAEDIKVIGIKDLTIMADYFVIATGTSTIHVRALAEEVDEKLAELGIKPLKSEKRSGSSWLAVDYGDIIVHIFTEETRKQYSLERLWADGEQVDIAQLLE